MDLLQVDQVLLGLLKGLLGGGVGAVLLDDAHALEVQPVQQVPVGLIVDDAVLQVAHDVVHLGIVPGQGAVQLLLADLAGDVLEVQVGDVVDVGLQEVQGAAVALLPAAVGGGVVAVVTSVTALETGEIFQHTISRHRVDKFRFVETAKRQYVSDGKN